MACWASRIRLGIFTQSKEGTCWLKRYTNVGIRAGFRGNCGGPDNPADAFYRTHLCQASSVPSLFSTALPCGAMWLSHPFFKKITLLLFNYSCLYFPTTPLPHPSHTQFPPLILPHFVFVHVSVLDVPENTSHFPHHDLLPPPLWLLSVCSLFQCLWLYLACLFVLLIRLHFKVRSYGICPSPPGLFHLA